MPRPSDTPNGANDAVEHPILHAWPEFWWMSEQDRSDAFEARALAYGGTGYRGQQRER
jgi:hypothetical protein